MNEHQSSSAVDSSDESKPRWKPLGRIERRVAGVLIEKAKTTPDQYPMTINGLVTGSNQKSNRDPQMQLEEDDVLDALDTLKAAGAVIEIQGSGRVAKYRHLLYEWLGVDKVELAVMAELLLRGAQTEGELRGRASRMEPIADLNVLRGILDSLRAKGLVLDLTPPGRGQIISHALYEPDELERLREKSLSGFGSAEPMPSPAPRSSTSSPSAPASGSSSRLEEELRSMRSELTEMRRQVEDLAEAQRRQEQTIADLRSSLGG
jgi:uncharacterized protein